MQSQKESSLSIAIKDSIYSLENGKPIVEKKIPANFTIKIANTREEREEVFRLGYQVYLEKGYIKKNVQEWLVQSYDTNRETIILIVQDQSKAIAGSVTLVFNESMKLPAEKIYSEEIKSIIKKNNRKLVEVSRLIINPDFRNAKEVLVLLFNYLCIYSYQIKNYDNLVIEVNPRHKNYYKEFLSFDEIGAEKSCPNVENAPAILLTMHLNKYRSEVTRCANTTNQKKKERSFYQYFLKLEQESLVVYYLKKQIKPMSADEKQYFGFSESGSSRAVCLQ